MEVSGDERESWCEVSVCVCVLADFPCVPILISLVNMVSELDLSISALEVDELATLSVYKKEWHHVTLAHEQQKKNGKQVWSQRQVSRCRRPRGRQLKQSLHV